MQNTNDLYANGDIFWQVTREQANYIFTMLDKLPRGEVNELFVKLFTQAQNCVQAAEEKKAQDAAEAQKAAQKMANPNKEKPAIVSSNK